MNEILRTANFIVQKFLEKKLDKAADLAVETGHEDFYADSKDITEFLNKPDPQNSADDRVIIYDRKR